jgi:tRNA modification GTPase
MDAIIVVNKVDLPQKIDFNEVKRKARGRKIVKISVKDDKGIEELETMISNMYMAGNLEADDLTYVSNARHIGLLNQALQSINDALDGIGMEVPIDIVQIDMTKTWELLGEIIGESVHDELINKLFSQFCLGK